MDQQEFEEAKKSMERWYWWGIPTFFRCPWNEDPAACDIALVVRAPSALSRPSTGARMAGSESRRGACVGSTTWATFPCWPGDR
jgi:hypothetical protein